MPEGNGTARNPISHARAKAEELARMGPPPRNEVSRRLKERLLARTAQKVQPKDERIAPCGGTRLSGKDFRRNRPVIRSAHTSRRLGSNRRDRRERGANSRAAKGKPLPNTATLLPMTPAAVTCMSAWTAKAVEA